MLYDHTSLEQILVSTDIETHQKSDTMSSTDKATMQVPSIPQTQKRPLHGFLGRALGILLAFSFLTSGCGGYNTFINENARRNPGYSVTEGKQGGFKNLVRRVRFRTLSGTRNLKNVLYGLGWGVHYKTTDGTKIVPNGGYGVLEGTYDFTRKTIGLIKEPIIYAAKGFKDKYARRIWSETYWKNFIGGPVNVVLGLGYDLPREFYDKDGSVNFIERTIRYGLTDPSSGFFGPLSGEGGKILNGFSDSFQGLVLGIANYGLWLPLDATIGNFEFGADTVSCLSNTTDIIVTYVGGMIGGHASERAQSVGWDRFSKFGKRTLGGLPFVYHSFVAPQGYCVPNANALSPGDVPNSESAVNPNVKPRNFFRGIIETFGYAMRAVLFTNGGNDGGIVKKGPGTPHPMGR